jgi:hypothetical protein
MKVELINYKLANSSGVRKIGLPIILFYYISVIYLLSYIAAHRLFGDIIASFWGMIGFVIFLITLGLISQSKKYIGLLNRVKEEEEWNNINLEQQIIKTESRYYGWLTITILLSGIYLLFLFGSTQGNDHWGFG